MRVRLRHKLKNYTDSCMIDCLYVDKIIKIFRKGKSTAAGGTFCLAPYGAEVLAASVIPPGMAGISVGGMFFSGEAIMDIAMTTSYSVTFSNVLVTANDFSAYATGTNVMSNTLGQENYEGVKYVSKTGSDTIFWSSLANPRFYGTNNNVGNIRQNAMYDNSEGGSKTGTVWDNITPTQENYPFTNIPKSFEVEVNGEKMWVHGNATEHMYEDVYKGITTGNGTAYTNPNLYTQEIMSDFYGSLQEATKSGIVYVEKITQGNWEFIFAQPRQAGQLPVIKHAQFNGWHYEVQEYARYN